MADTALRIGQALGVTRDFWLDPQRMYDLDVARATTDTSGIESLVQVSEQDDDSSVGRQTHLRIRIARASLTL